TITFQNYFRLYKKLAGMTGTALTEESEFQEIYGLDVIEIPTNRPLSRTDHPDVIYRNERAKFDAVCRNIKEAHDRGQPVLVGTISIEKSELLAKKLKGMGVPHQVLNAKQHEREAQIIAQAGKKGAVTIATNMAGRGTDIMLGGNAEYLAKEEMRKNGFSEEQLAYGTSYFETEDENILLCRTTYSELESKYKDSIKTEADEVRLAGGLMILGTERHESRRIDNQLRGRAGRQGDPGESRFYLSMEDNLLRLFGGDNMIRIVDGLGLDEDEPIEAKIMSSSIEAAQKRVEGRNFDIRKHVLQYDDVMNKQREVIYGERRKVLDGENLRDSVVKMVEECIKEKVSVFCSADEVDSWNFDGLRHEFMGLFLTENDIVYDTREKLETVTKEDLEQEIIAKAMDAYATREREYGEVMREVERMVMLQCVDTHWMNHIDDMDELRRGIGLRAYGQRDPVVEYKFEGYDMFDNMIKSIREDTVRMIFAVRIRKDEEIQRKEVAKPTSESGGTDEPEKKQPIKRDAAKVGRNDPCPCGSGLKYKKCCGK
ncbi:MAG: SEC-C metal-binding domain-containing protein, partial [Oscillospiraceae bacterium]